MVQPQSNKSKKKIKIATEMKEAPSYWEGFAGNSILLNLALYLKEQTKTYIDQPEVGA